MQFFYKNVNNLLIHNIKQTSDFVTKIIEDKELQGYDLSGSEIVKLLNSKLDTVPYSFKKIEDTEITALLEDITETIKNSLRIAILIFL